MRGGGGGGSYCYRTLRQDSHSQHIYIPLQNLNDVFPLLYDFATYGIPLLNLVRELLVDKTY